MAAYETSLSTSLNAMRAAEIWLHERSGDSPSIRELANYLGYSEAQIRRNFNRFFGISVVFNPVVQKVCSKPRIGYA